MSLNHPIGSRLLQSAAVRRSGLFEAVFDPRITWSPVSILQLLF